MGNELKPHDVIIDNLLAFDDDCYFDGVVFQSLLYYVLSTEYISTLFEMCTYLPTSYNGLLQSVAFHYTYNYTKNNVVFHSLILYPSKYILR